MGDPLREPMLRHRNADGFRFGTVNRPPLGEESWLGYLELHSIFMSGFGF